jgi:phosphoribosyl 1,2-cyclic phosphate phosphodiesterase
MQLTFLGTGTSHGVPMIGCSCPTCLSTDPRDQRTNASVLITFRGKRFLVDCGRDFRQQALRWRLDGLDYVLITHTHFDHVAGIDDLRVFTAGRERPLPLMGMAEHLEYLKSYIYHYLFEPQTQRGGGLTEVELVAVEGRFLLEGLAIETLPVFHGRMEILGYRFGSCAYLSDVSGIPNATLQKLFNLELLILGALRHTEHPTHLSLPQALAVVRELKPRRTYLTHLCHDVLHEQVERRLAEPGDPYFTGQEVHLAYDGLSLEI